MMMIRSRDLRRIFSGSFGGISMTSVCTEFEVFTDFGHKFLG